MPRISPRPEVDLSAADARRFILRAQGLGAETPHGGPSDVLRRLGAVQLDTISVLARSHELVPYARLGAVGRAAVEGAYWAEPATAFEYLAHANCILPIDSWPHFAGVRRKASAREWRWAKPAAVAEVLARLRDGPVTATELGGARASAGWWNWSDAKIAVETLYGRGEVVCVSRRSWKRVYDLPERVIPQALLAQEPSDAECLAELVGVSARALGVATKRDLARYFVNAVSTMGGRTKALDAAIEAAGLVPVAVEGWAEETFAAPGALAPFATSSPASRTTLLSPFDSLLWDRDRAGRVFDFAFKLEAYVPKDKRVRGYFTMPLLAEGRIVGHVDPAREGSTLVARQLALGDAAAVAPMARALREAASWVGCTEVRLERVEPATLSAALANALGLAGQRHIGATVPSIPSPSPAKSGEGAGG